MLGGGSNVLVADEGIAGTVIQLSGSLCKMEIVSAQYRKFVHHRHRHSLPLHRQRYREFRQQIPIQKALIWQNSMQLVEDLKHKEI